MSFSSQYQAWLLKDHGAAKMPIPILPESYTLTYGNRVETVNILELGEVILRGSPNGIRVAFDSYFPVANDPWTERYVEPGMRKLNPSLYRFAFKAFIDSEKPLQLVIVGTPVNFFCYCEKFVMSEEGGIPDLNYSISFAEYRQTSRTPVEVDLESGVASLPPLEPVRMDTRIAPASYTLKTGDTLATVARELYGKDDVQTIEAIYELNRDKLDNMMLIKPGLTLKMPF